MPKIISVIINAVLVGGGLLDPEQAAIISAITDEILSIVIVLSLLTFSLAMPIILRTTNRRLDASRIKMNTEVLAYVAAHAVHSAEQLFEKDSGAMKFDYASKILLDFSKSTKIDHASSDLCRVMIESAVKEMKFKSGEFEWGR